RENLIEFLKFVNNSKITLLLDEAYSDSVKIDDELLPKWRSISRYVFNNENLLSKIRVVSSLSTTKNLAGSGDRLGAIVATPAMADVVEYANKRNSSVRGNSASLYFLNEVLEVAIRAKGLKDKLEAELPKNASRSKVRGLIENFLVENTKASIVKTEAGSQVPTFEGSPLYLFLLDELVSLDKLDILNLPDDFKYKDVPFFSYYSEQLIKGLNRFRINKSFRSESIKRLSMAKRVAAEVIEALGAQDIQIIDSDGSYLFNLLFTNYGSYNDLEIFCMAIGEQRGLCALPYKTGVVRFSLGGYLDGSSKGVEIFEKEIRVSLTVFLSYWMKYRAAFEKAGKNAKAEDVIKKVFPNLKENQWVEVVLEDFSEIRDQKKKGNQSLKI